MSIGGMSTPDTWITSETSSDRYSTGDTHPTSMQWERESLDQATKEKDKGKDSREPAIIAEDLDIRQRIVQKERAKVAREAGH